MREPDYDALLSRAEVLLRSVDDNRAALLGEEVRAQRSRWAQDRPQIALVSGFTAGKTTLLKHWFGLPGLPVGRVATTAAVTRITHGDPDRVVLRYREATTVPLHREAAGNGQTMAGVLEQWAGAPDDFHITGFGTVDGVSYSPGQVRQIAAAARRAPADTYEEIVVRFRRRPPEVVSLEERQPGWLGVLLTDPAEAMALAEVVCHARHRALRRVTMVDTAGYGAATTFHEESTQGVLRRRPETTIVLTDVRRMDDQRFRHVVADVWSRIAGPRDVGAVIVGLTFWQSFVTATADDRGVVPDAGLREELLAQKREELARLLPGDRLPLPLVVPIEVNDRPPADAGRHLDALLDEAVGRARRRPAPPRREETIDLIGRAAAAGDAAAEAAAHAYRLQRAEADRLADQVRALTPRAQQLRAAVDRCAAVIDAGFAAEKEALVAEVENRQTRREIRKFAEDGYAVCYRETVVRLRELVAGQAAQLCGHLGALPALTLASDPPADRHQARVGKVMENFDVDYWALATAEIVSPKRLADDYRDMARLEIRVYAREDVNNLHAEYRRWWAGCRDRAALVEAEMVREQADAVALSARAEEEAGAAAVWTRWTADLRASARALHEQAAAR